MIDANAVETDIASLQEQLRQSREEAELTLEQLHLVQEELEIYFLRCEDLQEQLQAQRARAASAPPQASAAPLPLESLMPLLPVFMDQLSAEELTNLARSCNNQRRHELALPLLDAAVAKSAASDPINAAWRQLQAVRTRLALGQGNAAWQSLTVMAEQQDGRPAILHRVHQQLAWLALQRGQTGEARQQISSLDALEPDPALLHEQEVLQQAVTISEQLPGLINDCGITTRMPEAESFGVSLDVAVGSAHSPWIYAGGWLLDPAEQLTALLLAHGNQLIRLTLPDLARTLRSDLADLQQQHGLPADHLAGFRVALHCDTPAPADASPAESSSGDGAPPDAPQKLGLIALRVGQPPVTLARPFAPAGSPTPSLYSLAAATLHSSTANPADWSTWNYPAGC